MATKLEQLTIRRVALVDKGANQEAFVTLFKRDSDAEEVQDMAKDKATEDTTVTKADYEAAIAKAAALEAEVAKAADEKAAAVAEAETVRAELAKRDEAAEIAKFDAQAKAVPFLGDKGGAWLRKIAGALGDEYPAFQTSLAAVQKQEEESVLLKEIGSDGDTEGNDFDGRVSAVAKRLLKENPSMTQEQAYVAALETPEVGSLYAEARKTKRGR
jgi:hypothetical protein